MTSGISFDEYIDRCLRPVADIVARYDAARAAAEAEAVRALRRLGIHEFEPAAAEAGAAGSAANLPVDAALSAAFLEDAERALIEAAAPLPDAVKDLYESGALSRHVVTSAAAAPAVLCTTEAPGAPEPAALPEPLAAGVAAPEPEKPIAPPEPPQPAAPADANAMGATCPGFGVPVCGVPVWGKSKTGLCRSCTMRRVRKSRPRQEPSGDTAAEDSESAESLADAARAAAARIAALSEPEKGEASDEAPPSASPGAPSPRAPRAAAAADILPHYTMPGTREIIAGKAAIQAALDAGKTQFAGFRRFDLLIDTETGDLLPVPCYEKRFGHTGYLRASVQSGEWTTISLLRNLK